MTRTITVDHLARIEGHSGITVVLGDDGIEQVELRVFEGIRLVEGLVQGRAAEDVAPIVSRICAICSHGHAITATAALEDALGVTISPQTRKLRDLGYQGACIESHALHLFFLAVPDLIGLPSAIHWAEHNREAVSCALRLKKLGNTIQEVIGGRAVHPMNYVIGGFGKLPSADELSMLRHEIDRGLSDCRAALDLLEGIVMPCFARQQLRLAALSPHDGAWFFGTTIDVSDGPSTPVRDYLSFTNERAVPLSHAKHSLSDGRSYMVGALARLSLHGQAITGLAHEAWRRLGLTFPADNVLSNNVAQVVELTWSVERAANLVDDLLYAAIEPEAVGDYCPREGRGVAATEVPRGMLFHDYELDSDGRVRRANVITPTAQNLAHLETQLWAAVDAGAGADDDELARRLQMIVRAYDPCISCSVHVGRIG